MNALRSATTTHDLASGSRSFQFALLAILIVLLFAPSHTRADSFTMADVAGTWKYHLNLNGQPYVDWTINLREDGSTDQRVQLSDGSFTTSIWTLSNNAVTLSYPLVFGRATYTGTLDPTGMMQTNGTSTSNGSPGAFTFTAEKEIASGEIEVRTADGTLLSSGTSTVDFGTGLTTAAKPAIAPVKFVIKNTGKSPLNISSATISAGPFHIVTKPGKKIPANSKTNFTVAMTPNGPLHLDGTPATSTTTQTGRLIIYSDDPKTRVFKISLTGKGGSITTQ